jgi:hypothetical protein
MVDNNYCEGTSFCNEICGRLRFLREKHFGRRSKRKFAMALEIPLSTYASYEAGRVPPPAILVKASEVTGCDLQWLMTGNSAAGLAGAADPEISAILGRMEQLISSRPQARQAVTALLDLLSVQPAKAEQVSAEKSVWNQGNVIPILGRAVAGVPSFWESSDDEYAGLSAMIQVYHPENIRKRFKTELIEPVCQRGTGQAEIIQLAEPIALNPGQIDGVILVDEFKGQGKLFAVSLVGDSMSPRLESGDYAIVDSGVSAAGGGICLVELRDRVGAMCKMYYPEDSQVRLSSLNPVYDPIVVDREQVKWAFKVVAAVKHRNG